MKAEVAAVAARMVVEEGLEFGPAKRRAAQQMRIGRRAELPDNDQLEVAVREYIELFCADTQPAELAALRRLALVWMERLAVFRPHVAGAVWRGTATRLSDIHLQLFCDDSKSAEIALINQKIKYDVGVMNGFHEKKVDTLHISSYCEELAEIVGVHLAVLDHDDLRGALRPDATGRSGRGDASALRKLLMKEA